LPPCSARLLKAKALASLRRCARAFNDFDDDGRVTTVLLHLQHAFEMLLKAGLVEKKVRVLDKSKGRSISFDKCVRLGAEHLRLSADQCGLLRTIDALRDDEQHYFGPASIFHQPPAERWGTTPVSVWGGNRARHDCDGSRPH
jgi:hypothetical protein